jgi:hypothetical protein
VKTEKQKFIIQLCRIIRWVTEESDTMKETAGDKLQSVIIDMSRASLYFEYTLDGFSFIVIEIKIITIDFMFFSSDVMNIDTSGLTALEEIHKDLVFLNLQVRSSDSIYTKRKHCNLVFPSHFIPFDSYKLVKLPRKEMPIFLNNCFLCFSVLHARIRFVPVHIAGYLYEITRISFP